MRRGRIAIFLAVLGVAVTCGHSSVARADDGGGPSAICADLQDGKLDGSYTPDQWSAFLSDPTVQGYCSAIVPPAQPTSPAPPAAAPATPPAAPTVTPSAAPVPLTPQQPVVVVGVKGAQHTVSKPVSTGVKGAQHTVALATPTKSAAGPIGATKTSGTLPFTGAQLSLFLLVGLALVATGFLLRTTARTKQRP